MLAPCTGQLPFDRPKGTSDRGHHFAVATGLIEKPIGPALMPKQVDYAVRLYPALGDHFGKSARHEKQYLVALAARGRSTWRRRFSILA